MISLWAYVYRVIQLLQEKWVKQHKNWYNKREQAVTKEEKGRNISQQEGQKI